MLARLLRLLIAVQVALGAWLGGWLAAGHAGLAGLLLAALAGALAAPPLGTLVTIVYSFVASRTPEAPAAWWRALAGELVASARIFLLRQPWATAPPAFQPASAGPQRIPVLLVHGFVCNHRIWDNMAPALRAQGHAVQAVNLEPVFGSIDDYAEPLEHAVQALCRQTGQDRVALVGHSMGGLAIRAWMRRHGTRRVARVVTLGTPHAGTRVRAPLAPPNGRQMAWQSDWLRALAASETAATRALLRVALSPQDNIVYPQRAQVLEGVTPVVFDGLGHLQLCTAPQTIRWVGEQLDLG